MHENPRGKFRCMRSPGFWVLRSVTSSVAVYYSPDYWGNPTENFPFSQLCSYFLASSLSRGTKVIMWAVSSLSPWYQVTYFTMGKCHRKILCFFCPAPFSLRPHCPSSHMARRLLLSISLLPTTSYCSTLVAKGTDGRGYE